MPVPFFILETQIKSGGTIFERYNACIARGGHAVACMDRLGLHLT
jgi:hypothetical protein